MKLPTLDRPPGITIYCPYKNTLLNKEIAVFINSYERKPSPTLLGCSLPELVIGELNGVMKREGILFSLSDPLEKGFYKIEVVCNSMRGEELYPILHDETSLIIGMPYSSYPPIELN